MSVDQTVENTLRAMRDCQVALSVDCVIFGYDQEGLKILLVECNLPPYQGTWSLLGDFVLQDEDLDEAAQRVLKRYTGLHQIYLEQVGSFGQKGRHPLGRVVTTAYYSLMKISDYCPDGSTNGLKVSWLPVDRLPRLAFDHEKILETCHLRLQKSVRERPIGFELLPRQFTLSQLRTLYEIVLGLELDKRNFRRKLRSLDLLIDTGEVQSDVSHRPAKLFTFDYSKYDERIRDGIHFEI